MANKKTNSTDKGNNDPMVNKKKTNHDSLSDNLRKNLLRRKATKKNSS